MSAAKTDVERLNKEWMEHFLAEFVCMTEAGEVLSGASQEMMAKIDTVEITPELADAFKTFNKFVSHGLYCGHG